MLSCPDCGKRALDDWDYCFYCGAELIHENSNEFAYGQLFELMKLESERTANLDSKAVTYSGLLGFSVAILTAFGGIIAISEFDGTNSQLSMFNIYNILLMVIYFLTISSFIVGASYAFRAYNMGNINIPPIYELVVEPSQSPQKIDTQSDCYYCMDFRYFAENCDQRLSLVRKSLIQYLGNLILNNYNMNDEKSGKLNNAHMATLFGIYLFLMFIVIKFIIEAVLG